MTGPAPDGGAACDDGFVLLAVLGLLSILAAIGFSLAHMVRTERLIISHAIRQAEAEALADGITRLLAHRLTQMVWTDTTSVKANLGTWSCNVNDQQISYKIDDVQGLVDLNYASKSLLIQIIRGLGETEVKASELASAIVDFRAADDGRIGRREDKPYAQSDSAVFPKNAPFETVGELERVAGMSEELFRRLSRLVTVHARTPGVSRTTISSDVRDALNRSTRSTGDVILAHDETSETSFRVFRIFVTVTYRAGQSVTRQGIVERSRQSRLGFAIREWTRDYDNKASVEARGTGDCDLGDYVLAIAQDGKPSAY